MATADDTRRLGSDIDEEENTALPPRLSTVSKRNSSSVRTFNSLAKPADVEAYLASTTTAHPIGIGEEIEGGSVSVEKGQSCCANFCGMMDRHPIAFILTAAAIGIGMGIGLSYWTPDDQQAKETAILWIGLIGDLFIRSLKCIVLPLVFVSIAVSVMDMLKLGEAGSIVGTSIGLYVITTLCAAIIGCVASIIFSQLYTLSDGHPELEEPDVRIGCTMNEDEEITSYLTEGGDGSVTCVADGEMGNSTIFRIVDVNGYFAKSDKAQGPAELTFSQSLYQGLFQQMIDDNFVGAFYEGNFLGVIILGAGIAVALTRLEKEMPKEVNWTCIVTIQLLEELMQIFMILVTWIIKCTPFAVISLIASAIGTNPDLGNVFTQIGYLISAVAVGLLMQVTLVYCGLYYIFLRANPITYLKQMVPAYTMAFASASSAATIPVSLECAKATGQIPVGISRFVIPLGATVNMDGSGIYIICSVVWMAYQNGIQPGIEDYIVLIFAASFGSMGTAPVPSATIVIILSAYWTAFGSTDGNPEGLAYIIAFDWFFDRFTTMFNIAGDLTVCAIVANKVDKDLADKADGGEDVVANKVAEGLANRSNETDEMGEFLEPLLQDQVSMLE